MFLIFSPFLRYDELVLHREVEHEERKGLDARHLTVIKLFEKNAF